MDTNYEIAFVQEQLSSTWPNWRISRKLGKGSYGSVFEIERTDLGSRYTCALKVLHLESESSDPFNSSADLSAASAGIQDSPTVFLFDRVTDTEINDFVQGVSSEIDLMMRLKGVPNIVSIEDYAILRGNHSCTILIRMEELEPLDRYLARMGGSPDRQTLIRLGTDICSALTVCEHKNILHRDIKTSNLFYSEEAGFKLGDFGISRTMASIREKSAMSGIGTLQFMAPEIYQGRKYNNTADIYSLGIVLYILANNLTPPLCGTGSGQTASGLSSTLQHDANMKRLRGEPLPDPCNADQMLASVIRTACSPEPEYRFQTAEAFRNALLSCLDNSAAPAAKKPASQKKKNSRALLYALVAAAAIIVLLAALLLGNKGKESSETNTVSSEENAGAQPDTSDVTGTNAGEPPADSVAETGTENELPADSGAETEAENELPADSGTALIEWTDSNLRDAVVPQVQQMLGIETDITIADARKVPELDLTEAGISDISSLQYFTGLTKLVLSNNTVSDISFLTGLTKLEYLNLEKNLISDLSALSGLTKLTDLDLYSNNITDISPLAGLKQLTMLDLRANRIKDISAVKDMSLMEELYLSENADLYDLSPVSDMPSLRYLSVRKTSVSQIDALKNDKNLHNLIISWTNVSDISVVDQFSRLSYLDIRNCPVQDYGPANRVDARKGTKVEK